MVFRALREEKQRNTMKLIAFTLALLAVSGAATTFGREYRVAYFARSPELAAYDALAYKSGIPAIPLSSRSMREVFETCATVQQGLIYAFQPSDTQHAVDAACGELARKALVRNPTYSAAHTIVMLSSTAPDEIASALVLSQITAPRESWNAKLRLGKGLPLHGSGRQALDRALESDIAFMVQTPGGRAWLARLYQGGPALRPAIVSVIDRRPNNEKAAFLQEVRRLGED